MNIVNLIAKKVILKKDTKMNPFEGLQVEDTDGEIRTDKQFRNLKKKLKNKENKFRTNPSPELHSEIRKLEIMITEYGNKDTIPKRPRDKKRKMKEKTEDEFDEEAREAYRYNKKRQEQEKEKQEKERQEKEKQEKERRERGKYRREWRRQKGSNQGRRNQGFESDTWNNSNNALNDVNSKNCPEDIKNIYDHWDKIQWKKLQRKYHPDKIGGDSNKCVLLNNIKDYHEHL